MLTKVRRRGLSYQRPVPAIEEHQVLIKVRACAISDLDCKIRRGLARYRKFSSLPLVPGYELSGSSQRRAITLVPFSILRCTFAIWLFIHIRALVIHQSGVVQEKGADVTSVSVGDEVVGMRNFAVRPNGCSLTCCVLWMIFVQPCALQIASTGLAPSFQFKTRSMSVCASGPPGIPQLSWRMN